MSDLDIVRIPLGPVWRMMVVGGRRAGKRRNSLGNGHLWFCTALFQKNEQSVKHSTLPLMPLKRLPALLTMCKISVIILCGLRWTVNVNQLGLQKESSKNEKSFHVIPITVLTRLWPQNTFAYWSPTDKCDLIWHSLRLHMQKCQKWLKEEQQLHAEDTHFLWLQSSTMWSVFPLRKLL